jgi:phage baseplate assembly protein W
MNSTPDGRHLAFPFRIGSDGRTAAPADLPSHVRDELLQLVLTSPGERLFLPEFGGGVRKLVFEPADDVLAGVTKARLTQAINRWLGHRVTLEDVTVDHSDARLDVEVRYRLAGTGDSRVLKFQRTGV